MGTKELKSSKGITLIALVVTIIVLIILAGVSISTLKKKDGITKNANYAGVTNAYYSANQQAELAHTAVLTEIMNQTASNYNYNPTTSEETTRLADVVKKDLGITSGNTNGTWTVDSSEAGKIKITYTDDKIVKDSIDSETPRNDGIVNYRIKLKRDQDAELYVDVAQQLQPFRTYGPYENTAGYGAIGTRVFLVSGSTEQNPQTISVGNGTIQDNWKVFYEDEDFVYLIYGDYYPALNVQTAQDTIQLKPNSSYAYGVSDSTSRVNLLKYLRNYSGYTWSSSNDNFASEGTQYTSWSNLQTALSGLLSGKTISIQGSPDIELWVKSWEAKGNTDVDLTKNSNGYNIMTAGAGSNSNYCISLSGSGNSSSGTGYYDTLYFPYRESNSNAYSYWLASPGSVSNSDVCAVDCRGNVGSGVDYYVTDVCARPVVSIEK